MLTLKDIILVCNHRVLSYLLVESMFGLLELVSFKDTV